MTFRYPRSAKQRVYQRIAFFSGGWRVRISEGEPRIPGSVPTPNSVIEARA